MMISAKVSTIDGSACRITLNGIVSMPITALAHVGELQIGDKVLCWFDDLTLASGRIIGKEL